MDMGAIISKAREVRLKYSNNIVPIDLKKICAENNIKVFEGNLTKIEEKTGKKISGLIYIDKNTKEKSIYVNKKDVSARQKFTVAHELGHFYLHLEGNEDGVVSFRGSRSPIEYEADAFAAELLMPRDLLEKEFRSVPFPTASYLAGVFGVSRPAMQYRLKEMGLSDIGG